MSDITLNPITVQLAIPSGEELNQEHPTIQMVIPVGIPVPGPQGVIPLPTDVYRVPIPKALAIDLGKKLIEEAEKIPDPKPSIDIAGSLNDDAVRQAQDLEKKFRGANS